VDRFFELVGKVCGNRADDLKRSRTPHMSRPKSLLNAWCRMTDFALGAVVEKVNMSAHKLVTLLPPVCLVVALPCLAQPCLALPCPARPGRALPRRAPPGPENMHLLTARCARCCQDQPCPAPPSPARSCRASPRRAMPSPENVHLLTARCLVVALPCRARPCRAAPCPAAPSPASPGRAEPSHENI